MTSIATAARTPWWLRRHPDRAVWAAAAVGWAVIVALDARSAAIGVSSNDHLHHGWLVTQAGWLLMVVAMMGPATVPAVRRVAFDSLPRRRPRAVSIWLGGYLGVWAVFGVVATAAGRAATHAAWALPAVLLAAAGYELTARKRRALRSCHFAIPLPPAGRKADVACARAGVLHARACVDSCWLLMLSMAVAGHGSLLLMTLLGAIAAGQRWLVIGTRLRPPAAAALAAAAGVAIL